MHVSEIDTPALVVDLDIFERNVVDAVGGVFDVGDGGIEIEVAAVVIYGVRFGESEL